MAAATDRLVVRQSRAVLFDNCPRACQLADEVPEYDTHATARGTIFHDFARRILDECAASEDDTVPTTFARDLMCQAIAESGLPINAREHETLLGLSTEFVSTRKFDTRFLVDTEERYRLDIGPVTFTGQPDRVDIHGREARITDYKTGWAIDPDAHVKGTPQGRIYARFLFDFYPQIETVRLLWDYPRWGAAAREAVITREQLADIDAYLESLADRIAAAHTSGQWPASPGSWCAYCPDATQCPIPAQYRGDGSITTYEQAFAAGELVVALEALLARERKALRAWVNANDPFTVGNMEFAFKLRADTWQVADRDALRNAMTAAQQQLDRAAEAGVLGDDVPVDIRFESHFEPKKGYTEFKARKVKPPAAGAEAAA